MNNWFKQWTEPNLIIKQKEIAAQFDGENLPTEGTSYNDRWGVNDSSNSPGWTKEGVEHMLVTHQPTQLVQVELHTNLHLTGMKYPFL